MHTVRIAERKAEHVHKLCLLQKRTSKIILDIRNVQTPSNIMFTELNRMPLSDYFVDRKYILVFKVLHGFMPDYLNVYRYAGMLRLLLEILRRIKSAKQGDVRVEMHVYISEIMHLRLHICFHIIFYVYRITFIAITIYKKYSNNCTDLTQIK
jgi:hypothetical protein